jgi:hypothetical protein
MKRPLVLAGALIVGLGLLVPTALAADPLPLPHTGRVLISVEGDVAVPDGQQADVVLVVNGHADIAGTVNTLVVVDGSATLTGAALESVVAVGSQVEVGDGTLIYGELARLDSTVHQTGSVEIRGGITDMTGWFLEAGAVLAPAMLLLWIGFGLSTIIAGLFLAALAARQVRDAEALISREPLVTFLVGFLGVIAIPVGAVLLFVTIVGAPLGFGLLFAILPLLAFAGYLVAAIWTGDWILRRTEPATARERPFLAAVLGVVVLGILGLVPVVGLLVSIASLLGFGALLRLGFRALRGTPRPNVGASLAVPAPTRA